VLVYASLVQRGLVPLTQVLLCVPHAFPHKVELPTHAPSPSHCLQVLLSQGLVPGAAFVNPYVAPQ